MNDYRKLVNELEAIFEASDSAPASRTITKKSRQNGPTYTSFKNEEGDTQTDLPSSVSDDEVEDQFDDAQSQHDSNIPRWEKQVKNTDAAKGTPSQVSKSLLNPYGGKTELGDDAHQETLFAAQQGDTVAIEKLRDQYSPLLYKIAKSNTYGGMELTDSIQEANAGFLEALDSYNPHNTASFQTWITTVVGGLLKNYATSNMRGAVNITRGEFNDKIPTFNKLLKRYEGQGIDSYTTRRGIMHDMEIDDKTFDKLKAASATGTNSVHNKVPGADSDETTFEDMLSTNQTLEDELLGLDSGTITNLSQEEVHGIILDVANAAGLSDEERKIFYLAYGVGNNQSALSLSGIAQSTGAKYDRTFQRNFESAIIHKVAKTLAANPDIGFSYVDAYRVLKELQATAAGDSTRAKEQNSGVNGYINKEQKPKQSGEEKFRDKNRESRISGSKNEKAKEKESLADRAKKYRESDEASSVSAKRTAKADKDANKKTKTRKVKPQAQTPKDSSK